MHTDRIGKLEKTISNLREELGEESSREADRGFQEFIKWVGMVHLKPFAVEPHIVHEELGYGATPDVVGSIKTGDKEELAIIDWKTSKGNAIYPEVKMQVASYKQAWDSCYPENKITGGYHILKIGKDGSFTHAHYTNLDKYWEAFKLLLQLHKMKKDLK